jgi:flagellar export protein FliJ
MNDPLKESLKRLDRLVEIRQTYVAVAEAGVKEAEGEVRRLEASEREIAGHIQHNQALIAYLRTATGHDVQTRATYILALEKQRKLIMQSLEAATGNLEHRRREWTEAMREEKIVTKLQERRLQQWEREDDAAQQKSQDETSIARYVRTRLEK